MEESAVPAAGPDVALDGSSANTISRQPMSAFFWIDPVASASSRDVEERFDEARALGFDAIMLATRFSSEIDRDAEETPLRVAPDGSADDVAMRDMAAAARRRGLGFCLELWLDRIAPTASIARRHPEWFAYSEEGIGFCALGEGDPATSWLDGLIARLQSLGVDGICLHAAHRLPTAIAARLNRDARARQPGWISIAAPFGAKPSEMAALAGCGFDFAACSSCWWDGEAPWLADDLERAGALGRLVTFAAPPLGTSQALATWRFGLAGFLGSAWVMNGALASDQREFVIALNRMRRERAGLFISAPVCVSPPRAAPPVFARFDGAGNGLALAAAERQDGDRCASWFAGLAGELKPLAGALPPGAGLTVFETTPVAVVRPVVRADADVTAAVAGSRIAIEAVTPSVDEGRFPVKRIVGDYVKVEADLVCDGHGTLAADLLWRTVADPAWQRTPMTSLGNDRWTAGFHLGAVGRMEFTIEAWVDRYGAYAEEITKKHAAGLDLELELIEGRALVDAALAVAPAAQDVMLAAMRRGLEERTQAEQVAAMTAPGIVAAMRAAEDRQFLARLDHPVPVDAEPIRAGFASWYEIFPRSQSGDADRHGTFDDVIAALPRIRAMGFDVLYFPPIHPIGRTNRKGRNNSLKAEPGDPGSPYAIGADEGGHDALHPELGDFAAFRRLIAAAAKQGLEIALDFAIQCAPDHPWLREHPGWFDWRPDGSIKYAENPPKKYEDIVNVDFYAEGARPSLWLALRDVVLFWIEQGVKIFRVDNPHTKPFPFWEWMIADVRSRHPDAMFLAEAFTRPKLMYRLAKIGFSQSYTYFTWRNSAAEMREYMTELTKAAPRDFFRPHFFVNTPDINPVFLQSSGRAGFLIRAALAATLSGLWGVYNGFELCEAAALPGREEYLDSEKYQLRVWDHERPGNIVAEITALNRIRRQNPALHSHLGITFLTCSNDNILYFEKADRDRENVILVAISFDPFHRQTGEIELPLERFGLVEDAALKAEDLARDVEFVWFGGRQVVSLDPGELPYCIWRIRK